MRAILCGVLVWGMTSLANAATVCREQATGRIIQTQGEDAPGSCHQDLVVNNPHYGYAVGDIEELVVSAAEQNALVKAWEVHPANPQAQNVSAKRQAQQDAETAVKTKLNLNAQELTLLKRALGVE